MMNPEQRYDELIDELFAAYAAGDREKAWQTLGELVRVDRECFEWNQACYAKMSELEKHWRSATGFKRTK